MCYNINADSSYRKEVKFLDYILIIICSITANVISYYICKWSDREE